MIMKGDDGLPNKNEFVDNLLDLSSLIKISKHSYWSLSLSLSLSLSHARARTQTSTNKEKNEHMLDTHI